MDIKNEIDADVNVIVLEKDNIPEHASPEMAQLILKMGKLIQNNNKFELIKLRRQIRRRLFKIRESLIKGENPDPQYDSGLRAWIELQFDKGRLKWYKETVDNDQNSHTYKQKVINGGFTFDWDISVEEPLKVIEPIEWDGEFDQVLYSKCNIKKCVPPAFTKQK